MGESQMEQLVLHMRTLHELKQKEYKENRKDVVHCLMTIRH